MLVLALVLVLASFGVILASRDLLEGLDASKQEFEDLEYPNEEDE